MLQAGVRWNANWAEARFPCHCDQGLWPSILPEHMDTLLQIACMPLVTSCECKRSASALRRLNNYLRASMGKDWLSSLALMHIHHKKEVDLDEVTDIFARLHWWKMEEKCDNTEVGWHAYFSKINYSVLLSYSQLRCENSIIYWSIFYSLLITSFLFLLYLWHFPSLYPLLVCFFHLYAHLLFDD